MEFFNSRFTSFRDFLESGQESVTEYANFDLEQVLDNPAEQNFYDYLYSGYDFSFEEPHDIVHSFLFFNSMTVRILLAIVAVLFPSNK